VTEGQTSDVVLLGCKLSPQRAILPLNDEIEFPPFDAELALYGGTIGQPFKLMAVVVYPDGTPSPYPVTRFEGTWLAGIYDAQPITLQISGRVPYQGMGVHWLRFLFDGKPLGQAGFLVVSFDPQC
jgi:hypothetical protein